MGKPSPWGITDSAQDEPNLLATLPQSVSHPGRWVGDLSFIYNHSPVIPQVADEQQPCPESAAPWLAINRLDLNPKKIKQRWYSGRLSDVGGNFPARGVGGWRW